jgi:heat shock protein HspQ
MQAQFTLGHVVIHKRHGWRGIIFDVDPYFMESESWRESLPENEQFAKDQPYYTLILDEIPEPKSGYFAEENLILDPSNHAFKHHDIARDFPFIDNGRVDPTYIKKQQ